jgi:hypothetical protein
MVWNNKFFCLLGPELLCMEVVEHEVTGISDGGVEKMKENSTRNLNSYINTFNHRPPSPMSQMIRKLQD